MLSITDLRAGTTIEIDGVPHAVVSYSHTKMGRGGAVVRTRLKNLKTGAVYDKAFHGNDKVDEAQVDEKQATFLYVEHDRYYFMDSQSFEQFEMSKEQLGDNVKYLLEGAPLKIVVYQREPINISLPIKMDFKIKQTEPGVRGDTAQGGSKSATLETGAAITVPLFVNTGDVVRIDTRDGSYLERVSK